MNKALLSKSLHRIVNHGLKCSGKKSLKDTSCFKNIMMSLPVLPVLGRVLCL